KRSDTRLEAKAPYRQVQVLGQLAQGRHGTGHLMGDRIAFPGHARDVLDVRSDTSSSLALHPHRIGDLIHATRGVADQNRRLLQGAFQLAQQ
ncbi:hypothetical protein GZ057_27810, partial [Klebsiella pneumoniae]|nr:hypothetical protein [Klebsiella pneumoniae]